MLLLLLLRVASLYSILTVHDQSLLTYMTSKTEILNNFFSTNKN